MCTNKVLVLICLLAFSGCKILMPDASCVEILEKSMGVSSKGIEKVMVRNNSEIAMYTHSVESGLINCSFYSDGLWTECVMNESLTEVIRQVDTFSNTFEGQVYFYDYRVYDLIGAWQVDSIRESSLGNTEWIGGSKIHAIKIDYENGQLLEQYCYSFGDFIPK